MQTESPSPMRVIPAPATRRLPMALLLVALTLLAYLPALRNGFIWDDDQYVTENRELRTPEGLASIWLTPGAPEHSYVQYYPLVHTTFWVEYHLWQLEPLGYHLVNILLQALAAVLLWRVLTRLAVPGAWFAAAVFAVHPVHVETVAWITERKNLLSGVLTLGTTLCYLSFVATSSRGRWRWYAAACVLFLGALLSKTVACTFPVVMLMLLWWKHGRVGRRNVAALLPFVLAGLVLGLTTAWIERTRVGAIGPDWDFTPIERLLIASRALWFYASKLAWPAELTFIYPRWTIDAGSWWQWLFVAGCVAVVAGLWLARRRIGAGPLVGTLCFVVMLGPALGFVNVYPMRFSFVADHFQYLASTGLIALGAAAAASFVFRSRPVLRGLLAAAVLCTLGALTWRQLPAYRNQETLWLDTLAKNPACWMARNNLGLQRMQAGRLEQAIEDFEAALAINPRHEKAHSNLGYAELQLGHVPEAIAHYEAALALKPDYPEVHNNLALALGQAGRSDDAIAHLEQALALEPRYAEAHYNLALALLGAGRIAEAIDHGEQAIAIEPDNAEAHNNLGTALIQAGRAQDAIARFERALALQPQHAMAHRNLGRALLREGRLTESIAHFEQVLQEIPYDYEVHFLLGTALAQVDRFPDAIAHFRVWLKAQPQDAVGHALLALALKNSGDIAGAIKHYEVALSLNAELPPALIDLARIRATGAEPAWRDGEAAVRLAESACAMTGRTQASYLDTLAAAYAEAGRFEEAVTTAQQAVALATSGKQQALATAIQAHLELFRAGQALREAIVPQEAAPPDR